MAQMWLLWWPKNSSAAAKTSTSSATGAVTATSLATKVSSSHCNRIAKLLRKLKKRGRVLCSTTGESSSNFQCRYDPLSYSLNFDTSGCGSLLDEHYYQFCAFSSRFASNPGTVSRPAPDGTVTASR
ncbi:uncharacterized protein LOC111782330 [Cucurbita pepo subsp. pepo]|uniref:uncharacterized protein LOC111782330 n=1 Tax=Cucurbita pepo subsp. pepo TaxID=3664 RepID=UPI000C9D41C4|nr:uncharacterized protein LOC111782330 [Cucurbita pepo subsp. pepo]